MPKDAAADLERLIPEKRFPEAAEALSRVKLPNLARSWASLTPMTKLTAFKLLPPDRAMEFYDLLPFDERYFIFSGFYPMSAAPVLESLPITQKKLFVELPRWHYEKMLESLLRETDARSAATAAGARP